jgi:hypothetical protein
LSELAPESALDLDRERDLGQILSTCLALYTRHFLLFAALALGVVLPIDIGLYGVGAGELWSGYDKNLPLGVDIASNFVPTLLIVPLISANHARAVIRLGAGHVPPIGRTLLEGLFLLPAVAFVVLLYDLGAFGGLAFPVFVRSGLGPAVSDPMASLAQRLPVRGRIVWTAVLKLAAMMRDRRQPPAPLTPAAGPGQDRSAKGLLGATRSEPMA